MIIRRWTVDDLDALPDDGRRYELVDGVLDPLVPSLTVLELRDGSYAEVATAVGDEAYDATVPFPVRVVPASLVR